MSMTTLVDVSLSDGQTAAWGGAPGTAMLLGAMNSLGHARLAAIEVLSPAVIAQCLGRGENPLQRVIAMRERAHGTPLRATVNLLPAQGAIDVLAGEALNGWLRVLARSGISEVVLIDPQLDFQRLGNAVQLALANGLTATAALPYVDDHQHGNAHYSACAAQLVQAGAQRIMLRDEAGLLHGDRLPGLLAALRSGADGTPLDLHTRCHTGLGPQVALEAIRLGIDRLDVALPCVANGASTPSLALLIRSAALLQLPLQTPDQARVEEAQAQLAGVADQEGFAENQPWAFDLAPFEHQLPGEIAAEAMQALRDRARLADLFEYSRECTRIRQELGNPPMLQPFARAIAHQALEHLDASPRYATLQPTLRRWLQGCYGPIDTSLNSLQQRIGAVGHPGRGIDVPACDEALAALVCGCPALPPLHSLHYEVRTPEQALTLGLLQCWPDYTVLSVTGPGLSIHLEHSKG
jgi:oxaloacetate decarboxylase alpha subunit